MLAGTLIGLLALFTNWEDPFGRGWKTLLLGFNALFRLPFERLLLASGVFGSFDFNVLLTFGLFWPKMVAGVLTVLAVFGKVRLVDFGSMLGVGRWANDCCGALGVKPPL